MIMKSSTYKHEHLNENGCYEFFGAHVGLCIEDYADLHRMIDKAEKYVKDGLKKMKTLDVTRRNRVFRIQTAVSNYHSAKLYLFGGALERDIHNLQLPLSASFIQKKARKQAETSKGEAIQEILLGMYY